MTDHNRNSTDEKFTVDEMLALPRLSGLTLSKDGERLVVAVAREADGGKKMTRALYELDPSGEEPPRRLTRSRPGESNAEFAPDGTLLFTSTRPNPDSEDGGDTEPKTTLWALSSRGGEAYPIAAPSGGVGGFTVAEESGGIVFSAGSFPDSTNDECDAKRDKKRKDAGVGAQLFEEYPIRFWDHFLGPREPRLYATDLAEGSPDAPRDLTPEPGRSLDLASFDLTPNGETLIVSRANGAEEPTEFALDLIAIDVATGEERVLAADGDWYSSPACSPDGRHFAVCYEEDSSVDEPGDQSIHLFDLETGESRDLLPDLDLWPGSPVWSNDGNTLYFTADHEGHVPIFALDLESGKVSRLTGSGAYTDLCPAPDGTTLYALRSTVSEPPHPVVLDVREERQEPRRIRSFTELDELKLPSGMERISVETEDGTTVSSWLLLPPGASGEAPAPLALLVHGGPLNSWNSWHWRWNPHVFVDAGWAVLLPDPALSTGYGMDGIRRGWGRWGSVVYEDLMRAVDDAVARPGVDGSRTAALGGSFGGYMANWMAGHTDRFDAIVTHASLWDLESFHGTTDLGAWWEREFGDPYSEPERYRENDPRAHVSKIETPVLVVHGELDYRVPVSEALTLWTDLRRHGVESKFLYFPDENHWVLKPNNSRLWYGTVLAFIDHHARGAKWQRPELL